MIINKNKILQKPLKISKKIGALVLYIALFTSTNICYANNEFKISDTDFISRKDILTGVKIIALRGNIFDLTFKIPRTKGTPLSSSFEVTDDLDKTHRGKISTSHEVCNAYIQSGSEYNYPCHIRATLPKNKQGSYSIYRDFTATISIKKGSTQLKEIIEGRMPELAASLKNFKVDNNHVTLQIKNICSENIVITKINSSSYIDLPSISKITLRPGESYDIDLNLKDNIVKDSKNYLTDTIAIKYKTDNESLLSEVGIIINQINNTCESVDTNIEMANTIEIDPSNPELEIIEQNLEMISESSVEYSLILKNISEKNLTVKTIGLKSKCVSSKTIINNIELKTDSTHEFKFQISVDQNKSENCEEYIAVTYKTNDNENKQKIIIIPILITQKKASPPWYSWDNYKWEIATATALITTIIVTIALGEYTPIPHDEIIEVTLGDGTIGQFIGDKLIKIVGTYN